METLCLRVLTIEAKAFKSESMRSCFPAYASVRFPGLPPPPSEDWGFDMIRRGRSQTRGIACSDDAVKRRLYDLLDAAVKNAARMLYEM